VTASSQLFAPAEPGLAPLLELQHISKSFPGVRALSDVSIDWNVPDLVDTV